MKKQFIVIFLVLLFGLFQQRTAKSAVEELPFFENFESGWGDWWAQDGIWDIGVPTSGPKSATSDSQLVATVLGGNYPYGPDSRLISPKINLPEITADEEILLRFQQYASYQSSDRAYVQIQYYDPDKNEWSGWVTLDTFLSYVPAWHHVKVDLCNYAGKMVRVGFWHTDGTEYDGWGNNKHCESAGWYIDDVEIYKQIIPWFSGFEDFEGGFEDWFSQDGIWQVGEPTYGINSAYSGTQVVCTVLNGKYPYGPDSRLISPIINLPEITPGDEILLRFRQYCSYASSDRGDVQVQEYDPDEKQWSDWKTHDTFTSYIAPWHNARVDLTTYAGKIIRVGFYHSDGTEYDGWGNNKHSESAGWYIDDVTITGIEKPEYAISVRPVSIDFGNSIIGQIYYESLTIKNIGTEILTINEIKITGSDLLNFTIDTTPFSLDSDSSKILQVAFNPDRLGTYEAAINIANNAGDVTVPLSGSVLTPIIQIQPQTITFPKTDIGETIADTVQIKNTGTADLHTSSIQITGSDSLQFRVAPTTAVLKPDSIQNLIVTFAPQQADLFNAILEVKSDGGDGGVILFGEGVDTTITNYQLFIPDTSASAGDTVKIPIRISDLAGIAGAEFKVAYDSTILTALKAEKTSLTTAFALASSIKNGKIGISMACAKGLSPDSGDLVMMTFLVNRDSEGGDTTGLTLEKVALFDEQTDSLYATTGNGLFTVTQSIPVQIIIFPASDTLSSEDAHTFKAIGIDKNGKQVVVKSNWLVTEGYGNIGVSAVPVTGETTLFTANSAGDGQLIAQLPKYSLADTALIVVGDLKGDINLDEITNAQDAILCLQIAADSTLGGPYKCWAADMDNDGEVTSADALLILDASLDNVLLKSVIAEGSGPASVSIGQVYADSNNDFIVPVLIQERRDIFATDLKITFDAALYSVKSVLPAVSSSMIASKTYDDGLVTIALINPEGLVNAQGQLVNLKLQRKNKTAAAPELMVKHVNVFNRKCEPIALSPIQMQNSASEAPTDFALEQNFPNPFNPTTSIDFQIKTAGNVELAIYNSLGQKIKTLVNEHRAAGRYTAVWNGTTESGSKVTSGIYFYKLRTEGYSSIRKMVMMK